MPTACYQGRDLYDSRVSLIQYRELFNAFPQVTFPISVLASVTNQELASYAWIFPNVVTNGHWWYSNTPTFIEHDLPARLEAVPRTKQIGYYSDMYKLEFALPKFAMYKRILAKVLAERFVIDRGWSEERAVELGRQVLRGNVERIFRWGEDLREEVPAEEMVEAAPLPMPSPITAGAAALGTPLGLGQPEFEESPLTPAEDIRIEPSPAAAAEEEALDLGWSPTPEPMDAPEALSVGSEAGIAAEPDFAAESDFAPQAEAEPMDELDLGPPAEAATEPPAEEEFSLEMSAEEEPAGAAAAEEEGLEDFDLGVTPAEKAQEEEELDMFAFDAAPEPAAEEPAAAEEAEEELISLEEEPAAELEPVEPEPEPSPFEPAPAARKTEPLPFSIPEPAAPQPDAGGWNFNLDTSKPKKKK